LLTAAVQLARERRPPSIPEAAELALVSRATAYRYFPSAQALWEEATFEIATGSWDASVVDEAGDRVGARLDAAVTTLGWHMLDEEAPFRLRARAALELWFQHAGLPDEERTPVREGRRMAWNAKVVEPLRGRLTDDEVDELANALALVWGPEAVIVLRDVCRLDPDAAKATMLRAAHWLLAGALAEHGIREVAPPGGP
jgi:AcrR family transcriptional regulator